MLSTSPAKKPVRTTVAAVTAVLMMLTAGPAYAHDGAGQFDGYEIPPASTTFTNPVTFCARFNASTSDPLRHVLDMDGTFHGATGTGVAEFERTAPYYANPEGTHGGPDCLSPDDVGPEDTTMTIDFAPYECSGEGTYERRATSVYTLVFEGTCDDTGTSGDDAIPTTVTFDATQLLCPPADCSAYHPGATTVMSGDYEQTH